MFTEEKEIIKYVEKFQIKIVNTRTDRQLSV